MRYFHGDLIIHHLLISLCFHAREKPLLSRPRLLPCLHGRPRGPRWRSRPRLGAGPALPASRSAGSRDRGMQGMQGCTGWDAGLPSFPALPACSFPRLGRGHKRHYRVAATSCFMPASTPRAGNRTLVTKGLGVSHSQPGPCSRALQAPLAQKAREKLSILVSTLQPAFLEVLMSHFLFCFFFKKKTSPLSQLIYSDIFWLPSRWEMGPDVQRQIP